nr:hypothetical protein [Oceanococcus sp. HetDA_MAG_MS8]
MVVFRILLLIGLLFLLWMGWRWLNGRQPRRRPQALPSKLRCDRCGVALDPQEAQQREGRHYCSQHAQDD